MVLQSRNNRCSLNSNSQSQLREKQTGIFFIYLFLFIFIAKLLPGNPVVGVTNFEREFSRKVSGFFVKCRLVYAYET